MNSPLGVDLCEVVLTAPSTEWLEGFTANLVASGIVSNVHVFPAVVSTYRWHGEVVTRREARASLHTRRELVKNIVEKVRREHPYEVPSVSTRPIDGGDPEYLQWILDETLAAVGGAE